MSAHTEQDPTVSNTEGSEDAPEQEEQPPFVADLSVDSNSDTDSAIANMNQTISTDSLSSSIYNYVMENGRTYHRYRAGRYILPNDEIEQDRLDLQHHLFLLTLDGGLFLAPIETIKGGVKDVLDLGTGTGIWAIEFATEFPAAVVTGTDLSPIQPTYVPPNCHFEINDIEDEWIFSHQFDFIYGRALGHCFESDLEIFRSAFRFLRPGGYMEVFSGGMPLRCIDETMTGTAVERWNDIIVRGGVALGKNFSNNTLYKQRMEEVGFEDIVEHCFSWPIGTWAKGKKKKLLGMWCRENVMSGLNGQSMATLTRGLGLTPQEVELLLVDVRKEIQGQRVHVYVPIYCVYGRKPDKDMNLGKE